MSDPTRTLPGEQSRSWWADAIRSPDRIWTVAVLILGIGIVAQGWRALADGWVASGDDAFWAMMARSVFSAHPPMLGSSSSGGLDAGGAFHHLGPLGFYLLAPFVAVLGGVGAAVGASVINAASAVVAAIAVRSGVGVRAGWFTIAAGAVLQLGMGSELLVDPWNPHLATLPLWCALCCAWAVVSGGHRWAAAGVFAASFAMQTHLSFAPVAGVVGLVILGATAYWCAVTPSDDASPSLLRKWAPMLWALGVGFLANLIPLVQQFFGPGPGNITAALSGTTDADSLIGARLAPRVVSYLFLPRRWIPGDWGTDIVILKFLPGWWPLAGLVVIASALLVVALRRRSGRDAAVLGFTLLLCTTALFVTSRTSLRIFGLPMSLIRLALFRWVWPMALLVQLALLDSAFRLWRSRTGGDEAHGAKVRTWAPLIGLALVLCLVLGNIPPRDEGSGAIAVQRDAINEVLREAGPLVTERGKPLIRVGWDVSPVAAPALMDWLDERGYDFGLDDPTVLRQAGERFRADGTERTTVVIRSGASVLDGPQPGFDRVFTTQKLSETDLDRYRKQTEVVQRRLEKFVDRIEADPDLYARIGLGRYWEFEPDANWTQQLCGEYRQFPLGSRDVDRDVIADSDRQRLCAMEENLINGSFAVDIGPPPK